MDIYYYPWIDVDVDGRMVGTDIICQKSGCRGGARGKHAAAIYTSTSPWIPAAYIAADAVAGLWLRSSIQSAVR